MKHTICGLLVILLSSLTIADPARSGDNSEALRYTRRLPRIDKVELEKFKASEIWIESIKARKMIDGREAQAIASLWRTQTYRSRSPICHYPAYGIKFYSKGKLILYASLCWQCDNIEFMTPKLKSRQGFAGSSKKGKELLAVFRAAFPQ